MTGLINPPSISLDHTIHPGLHNMAEDKNKKETHLLVDNMPDAATTLMINQALKGVDLSSLAQVSEVTGVM